jgi:hypothetical protein
MIWVSHSIKCLHIAVMHLWFVAAAVLVEAEAAEEEVVVIVAVTQYFLHYHWQIR